MSHHSVSKRELEKLERIILKKAAEIEGNNEFYESKLLRSKYPPMNQRLCPWKEIRKEKKSNKCVKKASCSKTKKPKIVRSEPYFKNMNIAQQYNIYPVQKPIFSTPLQFIFIGEEEYLNLQNDIFRDDSKYLFPPNYATITLSKYFYKWKNKTEFRIKQIKPKKRNATKKKLIADANLPTNSTQENREIYYWRRRWLNDDYEISPISVEYYSQKTLRPTKASTRLFQTSLTESKIGDFQNDKIWNKIINCP